MKHITVIAFLVIFLSNSYAGAENNLATQIASYEAPQLFEDNDQSFMTRLALIDLTPKNGNIRVATFTFDFGDRVKQISAHLCKAAQRGVNVELLVDSKSGDQIGMKDPFDKSSENQKNEEIYSYLADCGAKVYIHNHLTDYVTFFGKRLPPIFPGVKPGGSVSIFQILSFVSDIKARFAAITKQALGSSVKSDTEEVFENIHSLYSNIDSMTNVAGKTDTNDHSHAADEIDTRIRILADRYKNFYKDPLWTEMNASSMKKVITAFKAAFKNDPELSTITKEIRLFNRLNHRKLFMVNSADNQQGCLIVGGRNLGDNYLANTKTSFIDGDVLVCKHHLGSQTLFEQAQASFENLKNDKSDDVLHEAKSNSVRLVSTNAKFQNKFDGSLLKKTALAKGFSLNHFSNPELITSGWSQPQNDEVRSQLIESINQETKEVFIETAYLEIDRDVRKAIESAVQRGVHVQIITNSFFISDGASKLIRLFMRGWVERMQNSHPKNFKIAFATLAGRHMIHFKGAGFRCQKANGETFRAYMIGSHNFHQRSGFSDKEHMLMWKEETSDCALPKDDLIASRVAYYAKNKVLATYPTMYHEFHSNISSGIDKKHTDWARAMMNMMYHYNPNTNEITLLHKEQVEHFQDLFENGGLQDFVGLLL